MKHEMVQIKSLEELMLIWPFVKKGIDRIKHRDKSCGSWTHSHLFNGIRFGLPTAQPKTTAVELFVAFDRETKEPKGFMVTTPRLDPFMNNVPCGIHVWLLYANHELIEEFLPALERLGKINGGDEIRFESGRLGWLGKFGKLLSESFRLGKMGKLGWRIHQVVYTREIKWK
jgi:hypothetical protein